MSSSNLEEVDATTPPVVDDGFWSDSALTLRMGIWSLSFAFCVLLLYLWYRCFHRERLLKKQVAEGDYQRQ